VAIDMKKLKQDLKDTAARCAQTKHEFKSAQRAVSVFQSTMKQEGKSYTWQELYERMKVVDKLRGAAASASWAMTSLCVFKAHLRGRAHLSANSSLQDQVAGWIAGGFERYSTQTIEAAG